MGPPFLHAVGESIASFLGPFGVEVHTYASNEPGTSSSDTVKSSVKPPPPFVEEESYLAPLSPSPFSSQPNK